MGAWKSSKFQIKKDLGKQTQILLMGHGVTFKSDLDKFSLNVSQEWRNTTMQVQIVGPKYQLSISEIHEETKTGEQA